MPTAVAPRHGPQAFPLPGSYAFQQAPLQVIGYTSNDAVKFLWEHTWIGS